MEIVYRFLSLVNHVIAVAPIDPETLKKQFPGVSTASPNLSTIIFHAIDWIVGFAGAIAIAVVIYAGYLRITADGDEDKLKTSNATIFDALKGIVMIILAGIAVKFIIKTVIGFSG